MNRRIGIEKETGREHARTANSLWEMEPARSVSSVSPLRSRWEMSSESAIQPLAMLVRTKRSSGSWKATTTA
jgi:hypothetical protein